MSAARSTSSSNPALEDFRKSLPRAGTPLDICPPDCIENHDAGKRAGRDHYIKSTTKRRRKPDEVFAEYGADADEARLFLA